MAQQSQQQVVVHMRKLTENKEGTRPFRLWDAQKRKQIAHRYYTFPKRAHIGALIEARWSSVGTCIEVYDARNGHLLGQYTRTLNQIEFRR